MSIRKLQFAQHIIRKFPAACAICFRAESCGSDNTILRAERQYIYALLHKPFRHALCQRSASAAAEQQNNCRVRARANCIIL